ncbi:MAG TPA: glycosyltransferase family 4 protein [Firmicutes bacterium]|nr:glycosyltransferase family 4 protein [Bacillota bacterium]
MRILIATSFYRNGQTTHVLSLCQELQRLGHKVFLIITRLGCPSYQQWLKEKGIPYSGTANPLKTIRLCRRFRPDLIHNHSAHTLKAVIELGRLLKIPTLTTIHYLDFAPRDLLRQQKAAVVISREMKESLDLGQMPVFLVENGVPLFRNQFNKKKPRQALFLAQTPPAKKENFRIMAGELLAQGWQVISAGDWHHPGAKNKKWQIEIEPLLSQASLLVGTGRAIREGMAAGLAAVVLGEFFDGLVTPANAARLRKYNFSGRAFKKQLTPHRARRLLKKLTPAYLEELSSFGTKYARAHFSITAMAAELILVYQQILTEKTENTAP